MVSPRIQIAAAIHRGHVRERNEDAISVCGAIVTNTTPKPVTPALGAEPHVVIVADGMGGHAHGDLASRSTLEFLVECSARCRVSSDWGEALISANSRLYDMMASDRNVAGFGTTVAGVAIDQSRLISFNVGDSRIYRYGRKGLIQLSHDDIPLGTAHPRFRRVTHQITQSIGGRLARTAIVPHLSESSPLGWGESLLLCSDGLTDMVDDGEIELALAEEVDAYGCCGRLLRLALDAGGRDNVSVIIVRSA